MYLEISTLFKKIVIYYRMVLKQLQISLRLFDSTSLSVLSFLSDFEIILIRVLAKPVYINDNIDKNCKST